MEALVNLKKRLSRGGKASGQDYRKGGSAAKGFANDPEFAKKMGALGGKKSKRKRPGLPGQ